ncbi:DUF6396 domain-containing protein [Pseudomonas sp. dw_358]|uniref:SEL1-like repeat protein n=1 Tax=Pseudomonas sp. dw_358 TaxID=2720083 RepID=UPI001BD388C6|nr:DUF6396 domain-containing protein [Pseudomonas sp. dw_358]
MSQELIDAGVATGYFFTAMAIQQGSWRLKQDSEMALRYYRRAADEGSAEAQAYVGEKLYPVDVMPAVGLQLLRCAAEQGHGRSALRVGIHHKIAGRYEEALIAFQLGVAAGNATAAGFLKEGFRAPPASNKLHFLGQQADPERAERAERYKIIGDLLSAWYYAKPKVPEINDIVPLPPAPLPAWDGKLQWVEERLANIPPEKPSEELIKRLADEKLLEPATGRPMPGSAGFDASGFPLKACYSGDICPQTGPPGSGAAREVSALSVERMVKLLQAFASITVVQPES